MAYAMIGNTPSVKTAQDTGYTHMDNTVLAGCSGTLKEVTFYCHAVGTLKVKIFRDDGTNFLFIGEFSMTTASGLNDRVPVYIPGVMAGDHIAWYSASANVIPDSEAVGHRYYKANDVTTSSAKATWATQNYNNKGSGRIYHGVQPL